MLYSWLPSTKKRTGIDKIDCHQKNWGDLCLDPREDLVHLVTRRKLSVGCWDSAFGTLFPNISLALSRHFQNVELMPATALKANLKTQLEIKSVFGPEVDISKDISIRNSCRYDQLQFHWETRKLIRLKLLLAP